MYQSLEQPYRDFYNEVIATLLTKGPSCEEAARMTNAEADAFARQKIAELKASPPFAALDAQKCLTIANDVHHTLNAIGIECLKLIESVRAGEISYTELVHQIGPIIIHSVNSMKIAAPSNYRST